MMQAGGGDDDSLGGGAAADLLTSLAMMIKMSTRECCAKCFEYRTAEAHFMQRRWRRSKMAK